MNKKIILLVAPLLMLSSCGTFSNPNLDNSEDTLTYEMKNGVPTVYATANGTHTTYLMMSRYGYVNVVNGEGETEQLFGTTIPEKYLEYAIAWVSEPNGKLPEIKDVGSTVNGATFRGWAMYTGEVFPKYLSEVPEENYSCVYAIFDGTNPGGNSGSEGGGESGDTFVSGTAYIVGNKDYSSGTSLPGESWNDVTKSYPIIEENQSTTAGVAKEYKATITFSVGDLWKIRTGPLDSDYLQDSNYESGGAIAEKQMSLESDGYGGTNVEVKVAGSYTIYFKIYTSGWKSMWVSPKN